MSKGVYMKTNENTCPVCRETFPLSADACPRCGFKLAGKTESFSPIKENDDSKIAGLTPALVIEKGPYSGERFLLGEGSFLIGRDPKCDIFLNNMTVSRHHATLNVEGENVDIVDEGSLNGTWVNGQIVDRAPLHEGTMVQVGTFEMIFKYVVTGA